MIPKDRHCDSAVIESKKTELANWRQMEAIDVVEDKGQNVISTRWVLTEKEYPDGEIKPKARLVIRGFEEEEEQIQTDAPTAAKTTLHIVLAIAVNEDWPVQTIDIIHLVGIKINCINTKKNNTKNMKYIFKNIYT